MEPHDLRAKLCFDGNIRIIRLARDHTLRDVRDAIRRAYEQLHDAEIEVKYEDSEGDKITVASDEDLILAFEEWSGSPNLCKLYVQRPHTRQPQEKQICAHFQRGFCRFGERCRDGHAAQGSSLFIPTYRQEKFLETQLRASAADNIEQLKSPQGLEMLHWIAVNGSSSSKVAYMLVKLLSKDEIRTSMMRQDTNRIYGALMDTRFIVQLQTHLNTLRPPTADNIEPYLLVVEELQLRTSLGWKMLPLDSLNALVAALPESARKAELNGKVQALLDHRRRLQLVSAVSEPDPSLQGADFRNLPIIPTKEELLMVENVAVPRNRVDMRYGSVIDYLETHFRLLREDFIEPLRRGIKEYQRSILPSPEVEVYTNVQLQGLKVALSGIQTSICFGTRRNREVTNKRLMFGSLLCISRDNFNTIIWATVHGRSKVAQNQVEVQLLHGNKLEAGQIYFMVESTSAYFEAYSHVLRSLQQEDMERIPFTEHLISLEKEVKEPEYIALRGARDAYDFITVFPGMKKELGQSVISVLEEWPAWNCSLDASQQSALKHALTKRLALIQGPPGTGKTFVGLLLIQLLLANLATTGTSPSEAPVLKGPILIVCHTNHALDQFLEGIYKKEKNLVRVGGRCKSKVLEDCTLHTKMTRSREQRNIAGAHFRASAGLRQQCQVLEKQIESCLGVLNSDFVTENCLHGIAIEEQIENLFYGHSKWTGEAAVTKWLATEARRNAPVPARVPIAQQVNRFAMLDDVSESEEEVESESEEALEEAEEDKSDSEEVEFQVPENVVQPDGDGWLHVNRRRNAGDEQILYPQQEDEEQVEAFPLQMVVDEPDVWSLQNAARRRLHEYWIEEIHRNAQQELNKLTEDYGLLCKQLNEASNEIELSLLRNAKVIGMTTTGASRLHDVLTSLRPEIVVVEEAAEVLEAHILASLSPYTKHLVLIGDHLQLRPSVATYKLAVKHQLDVSMFERLVSCGVEHVMLQVQRRMKPCISNLLSSLYPSLRNHECVSSYEAILGMKHDMFFMDHQAPENVGSEVGSKVNVGEAELVVELCNYLMNQNSYGPSDITILTMYMGQVQEITRRLKSRFPCIPRVSSVDDFQGEENDIVLLSLVRSNSIAGGKIGFLNVSNRVCVALSRARKGLYIFGNARLLAEKSILWNDIIGKLKQTDQIGSKLTLCCQNHPTVETSIEKALDFKNVEDGGCSRPCEYQLECGHVCPRRCHPGSHVAVMCPKRCLKPFEGCDHRCKQLCHGSEDCPPCSEPVTKLLSRCGHEQQVPCSKDEARVTCQSRCPRLLQCGHQCTSLCGRPCDTSCQVRVEKTLPCGHKASMGCYMDVHKFICQVPCFKVLPGCNHRCEGTCGSCQQGTLHIPCKKPCGRDLPCGHQCKASCTAPCPPCPKRCQKRCVHSICSFICGRPCKPCIEPCPWRCKHFSCEQLCYEVCKRPRCNQPCDKELVCGHPCIGICGEPCPGKCRLCHPETLEIISQTTLGESEPDDLFVELLDCHHIFEVTGLDQWMDMDMNDESRGEAIQLRTCPQCRIPIRRTLRYGNVVKRKWQQIEQVKKKVYAYDILEEALELIKKADFQGAQRLFKQVLQVQPDLLEAHFGMGVALCRTRKFDEASRHLQLIVEKSSLAAEVRVPASGSSSYNPLPNNVRADSLAARASTVLANKALVQWASALTGMKRFDEAIQLCDTVLKYHPENADAAGLKESARRRFTRQLVQIISVEVGTSGHWYECPNGHIYAIGECGGAMQVSRCPDCHAKIGGTGHSLVSGNVRASGV